MNFIFEIKFSRGSPDDIEKIITYAKRIQKEAIKIINRATGYRANQKIKAAAKRAMDEAGWRRTPRSIDLLEGFRVRTDSYDGHKILTSEHEWEDDADEYFDASGAGYPGLSQITGTQLIDLLEFGREPYTITPKSKKRLKFVIGGVKYLRRWVRIPGMRSHPFREEMRASLVEWLDIIQDRIRMI
jgi:hypothetical protein